MEQLHVRDADEDGTDRFNSICMAAFPGAGGGAAVAPCGSGQQLQSEVGTFVDATQMNLSLYSTVRRALKLGLGNDPEDESDNAKVFVCDGEHSGQPASAWDIEARRRWQGGRRGDGYEARAWLFAFVVCM